MSSADEIMTANFHRLLACLVTLDVDDLIIDDDPQLRNTLLLRWGSNPAGKPLQHSFCALWKHLFPYAIAKSFDSWACTRSAATPCPKCKLVMYCSNLCMEQHIRDHVHLCHSRILRQPSINSFTHLLEQETTPCKKSELHLPALSNPPLPVYGLLQDLGHSAEFASASCNSILNPFVSSSVLKLPKHLRFLFPCAYDLRNVLLTVSQIPENYTGRVALFINCAECILGVRDLLILELLRQHGRGGIDAAVALWFSTALTTMEDSLVLKAIRRVIGHSESSNGELDRASYKRRFQPASSSIPGSFLQAQLHKNLVGFLYAIASTYGDNFEDGKYWERQEEDDDNDAKMAYALPAHSVSRSVYHNRGLSLPFGAWNAHFSRPNRLRYSTSMDFIARYRHDMICGWNMQQVIASGVKRGASPRDLYGCIFFHVRDLMETFLQRIGSCHIELRVTQFDPEKFAQILQKTNIKFHRIDACTVAHYNMNHSSELSSTDRGELPEVVKQYLCKRKKDVSAHQQQQKASALSKTVGVFGTLLAKDASEECPSLLLTASLDWASNEYKNLVSKSEEYKKFESKYKEPLPAMDCSDAVESPYRYHTSFLYHHYRSERFPNMMCSIEDLVRKHFLHYVKEWNVDEAAKQMTGLERRAKNLIIIPHCIQFVEPRSGDKGNDLELEEKAQVHYFNLLFSGFTFLEQFQEWGWPRKGADSPSQSVQSVSGGEGNAMINVQDPSTLGQNLGSEEASAGEMVDQKTSSPQIVNEPTGEGLDQTPTRLENNEPTSADSPSQDIEADATVEDPDSLLQNQRLDDSSADQIVDQTTNSVQSNEPITEVVDQTTNSMENNEHAGGDSPTSQDEINETVQDPDSLLENPRLDKAQCEYIVDPTTSSPKNDEPTAADSPSQSGQLIFADEVLNATAMQDPDDSLVLRSPRLDEASADQLVVQTTSSPENNEPTTADSPRQSGQLIFADEVNATAVLQDPHSLLWSSRLDEASTDQIVYQTTSSPENNEPVYVYSPGQDEVNAVLHHPDSLLQNPRLDKPSDEIVDQTASILVKNEPTDDIVEQTTSSPETDGPTGADSPSQDEVDATVQEPDSMLQNRRLDEASDVVDQTASSLENNDPMGANSPRQSGRRVQIVATLLFLGGAFYSMHRMLHRRI